jgi:hypothetical protein
MWTTLVISKKLPKVIFHPMGENLPSLVTLIADSEKQGHLIKALFAQFSLF